MLLIDDDKLAIDFDRACNARLQIYDMEMEKARLSAGVASNVLGTPKVSVDRSRAVALNA